MLSIMDHEESSRIFHCSSATKSLSEFSSGLTNNDEKEKEPKSITVEKVEVGRVSLIYYISKKVAIWTRNRK